ncbi:MAG TPA: cytochrome b N-terminal domain-containing protein [Bryobacteraceae bacterium]|nr:cytochrome b N-terminal domain-containing protein [Bryobacteraceae bacterium]
MAASSYPEAKDQAAAPPGGLYQWIDERLGLSPILALARHKTVPQHRHSFWYYWGGISLFLFLLQMLTGVLLLVYFRPGSQSYESVRQITYDVDFGWLIRSAHSWSANLMVFAVFVHMFSVFFMKAYRKPREFGWWSGLALLGLTMVFGFSGYLLPMDELSYFATKVGLQIPGMIPGVGPMITDIVRGGLDVGEATVQRFFALHVVVLPMLFLPLLLFHLFLVQKHGNAVPPAEAARPAVERRSVPFFPNFFTMDLAMWLIALNVVTILATLYPWGLGAPADPLAPTPIGIHPEWYFMSQFQALKVLGRIIPGLFGEIFGMGLFTAVLIFWAVIPLFDRETTGGRRARLTAWVGYVMLAGALIFTIWGYATV